MKATTAGVFAAAALALVVAGEARAASVTVKNCTSASFEARAYRSDDGALLIASSAMSAERGAFATVSCPTSACKIAIAPSNAMFPTVLSGTYSSEVCIVRENGNIDWAAMGGSRCQPPIC
ncbi:MAG: hypothetical protein AB7O45_05680 [Alphaproteobacteria bacterium]